MRTRIASAVVAMAVAAAVPTFAAGVVKTEGIVGNIQIFAGSKTTGNGSMVTLCNYQDAETGHYLGQTQTFEIAFDNEADLFAYCATTMPAFE
jgi:hypothetical protein